MSSIYLTLPTSRHFRMRGLIRYSATRSTCRPLGMQQWLDSVESLIPDNACQHNQFIYNKLVNLTILPVEIQSVRQYAIRT